MPDLEERFTALRRMRAPDLWRDIELRDPRASPPTHSRGRRIVAATVALAVAFGGTLVLMRAFLRDVRLLTTPGSARIAFTADGGRQQVDLFSMNADGSDVRRVTDTPASEEEPAWSPDGTRIAFAIREPHDTTSYVIGVMEADGSNRDGIAETRLDGRNPVASPTWSPGGHEIAFAAYGDGGGIYVAPVDGGPVRRLTSAGPQTAHVDSEPEWSPDGQSIVFVRWVLGGAEDGTEYQIVRIDADGGEPAVLARFTASGNEEVRGLSWSPDGSRLAFTTRGSVHLLDPTTGETSEIVACQVLGCDGGRDVFTNATSWAPDGLHIAFTVWANRPDAAAEPPIIHVATLSGDQVSVVSTGVGGIFLAWQPVPGPAAATASPTPSELGEETTPLGPHVTATIDVGAFPRGVAVAEGAVWATVDNANGDPDDHLLVKIDPSTNEVVEGEPVFEAGDIAVGGGAVWVTSRLKNAEGAVLRLDPSSMQVVASVTVGLNPSNVAVGDGAVWATVNTTTSGSEPSGGVVRIDPMTNDVVARVTISGGWPRDVVVGDGSVWVYGHSGYTTSRGWVASSLWRIDPSTNEVVTTVLDEVGFLGDGGYLPDNVAIGEGVAWAADNEGSGVRIDVATGAVTTFRLRDGPTSPNGFGWPFTTYEGHVLFGLDPIHVLDADRLEVVASVPLESQVADAALDVATGTLWIANYEGTVTRIDLR